MAHATVNFISDALRRPVTIDVIFPTDKMVSPTKDCPKRAPLKTLYFLEGSTSGYHRPISHTLLQPYAEDNNVCVVVVGGEDKWYGDSDISGDYWHTMVAQDLINFTRDTFNLSHDREDTYIGGFSMGGFGAVTIGLCHPDIFGRILLFSPALCRDVIAQSVDEPGHDAWTRTNYATMFGFKDASEIVGSQYDYEKLAIDLAKEEIKPKFFISCGTIDGLFPISKKYADMLSELGYDVTFKAVSGSHNWCTALNEGIKEGLAWLPTDDFGENFPQTNEDSNYNWPDFFIWRTEYNTKDGKALLKSKLKGIDLTGYPGVLSE